MCNYFLIFGALFFFTQLAAHPKNPQVISGSATFEQSDEVMYIAVSDRAVLLWEDFTIAPGEMAFFLQENEKCAVLNRVIGENPSAIWGLLESNGAVYLINPNGLLISQEGAINAGAFIGSTLDSPDESFLKNEAGFAIPSDLIFQGDSRAAIVNFGTIEASDGDIALIGYIVENNGELFASEGTVSLAAGGNILFQPSGRERIVINPSLTEQEKEAVRVDNGGRIVAVKVELKAEGNSYALAINQDGMIEASSILLEGGKVLVIDALAAVEEDDFIFQLIKK